MSSIIPEISALIKAPIKVIKPAAIQIIIKSSGEWRPKGLLANEKGPADFIGRALFAIGCYGHSPIKAYPLTLFLRQFHGQIYHFGGLAAGYVVGGAEFAVTVATE